MARIDQTPGRRKDPSQQLDPSMKLLIVGMVAVFGGGALISATLMLSRTLGGPDQDVPANPIAMIGALLRGHVEWTTHTTVTAAALAVIVVGLIVVGLRFRPGSRGERTRVDDRARHLGRGAQLGSITQAGAAQTAARLGVDHSTPGVPIGKVVGSNQMLYGSWEDLHIDIWGPRTGKTTSRVIPAILDAPGAVIATSNKRDVVDATRGPRSDKGQVWVFDPQQVATEPPSWWWNPLTYVTDEIKAAKMAEHFAASTRAPGAKTDAYFDPEARDLIASLFLAAALGSRQITTCYEWVTDPDNPEPRQLLQQYGYDRLAEGLSAVVGLSARQRDGVFGTAKAMLSPLRIRAIEEWVTTPHSPRPHFDPAEFVQGSGTLYSLSREGAGSAGALVTCLTVAVIEAAEELATQSPGGRLRVPMVAALDEIANVVRWSDLPALYSHYGSRGIIILAILQSWAQGCDVWTEPGMRKLWSAANIAVYGGGSNEEGFLRNLSELIGDHDRMTGSISSGTGRTQVSKHQTRDRTLTVSDLRALPRGRAIVLSSGNPATLVETVPWFKRRDADTVRQSIATYDPAAAADE